MSAPRIPRSVPTARFITITLVVAVGLVIAEAVAIQLFLTWWRGVWG